jgi:hypothetical protein
MLLKETSFGRITIQYNRDLYILLNGQVILRDRSLSEKVHGTAHKIAKEEILEILKGGVPDILLIATGQDGLSHLDSDARELCKEKNIKIIEQPTPNAIHTFNQLIEEGQKVAGLIHITC